MNNKLLLGLWRYMLPVPPAVWHRLVRGDTHLDFMSEEHHRIRNFVVEELPRERTPLSPDFISQKLDLPLDQVIFILDDLEKHMTFLFRNEQGAVTWAYPVTVDDTPHHVTFNTGEQINAA